MEPIIIKGKIQKIEVKDDPNGFMSHALFLNGMWQYSSHLEHRYHETIATLPACVAGSLNRALVCGGGDGLAVRELLKFNGLAIELVELDPEMIKLYSTNPMLKQLNRGSLLDPRVKIRVQDASTLTKKVDGLYDLMILDFPSPHKSEEIDCEIIGKLYRRPSITTFASMLSHTGMFVTHTSIDAEFQEEVHKTLMMMGFNVWCLDSFYNEEGVYDNFTFASRLPLVKRREVPIGGKFITEAHIRAAFGATNRIDEDRLLYKRLFEVN